MIILLSANEAGAVRGPSAATPLAALEPVLLTDGRFILGADVLADPAHAAHFAFLAARPVADIATIAALFQVSVVASPSLGARVLNAVKSFFAPDPVG